jgi:hypothetical protein
MTENKPSEIAGGFFIFGELNNEKYYWGIHKKT